MLAGNGDSTFSQARPIPPCNSRLPQDVHGNTLAQERCFATGKRGGFSLCSLGSRGINPLMDIFGSLSFCQCPMCAEREDGQAECLHSITPRPPLIPHPAGHQDQLPSPEGTQLPPQGLTENNEILPKPSLQNQGLACSSS